MTPISPSSMRMYSSRVTSPSSMTMTMCGWSGCGGAFRLNRCRSRRWSARNDSTWPREPAIIRSEPMPSLIVGCWTWGSHLAHSHSCFARPEVTTAMSTSSGVWKVASWEIIARANARPCLASPSIPTAAKPRSAITMGRSGTIECARTNRRSARVVNGSSSSTGPVCGGTNLVSSRCEPRPTRRWQKSESFCRRSHMRRLVAIDHNACGSGWCHSREARCSATASRARSRIWPRYRR